jgi:hypothetical protein
MADYQLTATDSTVIRTADGAYIPDDPANRDYAEYCKWLDDGGVPDPYIPPPEPEPEPTNEQLVLFDHENRIREFEGQPPLSLDEFTQHLAAPAKPPDDPEPLKKRKR